MTVPGQSFRVNNKHTELLFLQHTRYSIRIAPKVIHGCSSWAWSKSLCQKLVSWEGRCLRVIVGAKRKPGEQWVPWLRRSTHAGRRWYHQMGFESLTVRVLRGIHRLAGELRFTECEQHAQEPSCQGCVAGVMVGGGTNNTPMARSLLAVRTLRGDTPLAWATVAGNGMMSSYVPSGTNGICTLCGKIGQTHSIHSCARHSSSRGLRLRRKLPSHTQDLMSREVGGKCRQRRQSSGATVMMELYPSRLSETTKWLSIG